MPIAIYGSGTVTGLAVGGLPDGTVDADTLAAGAGGKILQAVTASTTTQVETTSTTYADTNLSKTITPTSSSNKVLVKVALCSQAYATNSTSLGIRLLRGSTVMYTNNEYHWHNVKAAINLFYNSYFEFLDSPGTTSGVTYKIQGARYRVSNGTQQAQINPISNQVSFITLQEIVA